MVCTPNVLKLGEWLHHFQLPPPQTWMSPLLTRKAEYAWGTFCPECKEWHVPVVHHLLAVSDIDLLSRSDRSGRILEQTDYVLKKHQAEKE
jgi:hypothetical protein